MSEKNSTDKRSLLDMIKGVLKKSAKEIPEIITMPDEETADRIISKAVAGSGKRPDDSKTAPPPSEKGDAPKRSCPYATKRAIVESLQEIRRFAEEHDLAAVVVKALLSLLAEMTLGALKGKVSGKILEALLKAINYEADKRAAYREGEKAGKNAKIKAELFPEEKVEIPGINGAIQKPHKPASIFDIAKGESR